MLAYNRVGRGTYWRALGFAEALVASGYAVTILAVASNRKQGFENHEVNGVNVVVTPDLMPISGYDLWDVINRISWLRQRPFDLIHAFETRPINIFPALYKKKQQNIPLVTDWCDWFGRGGSVEQRQNKLLKTVLRPVETFFEEYFRPRAAGTTVINTILQKKAVDLGIPEEQVLLLPNGTNVVDFYPQPLKEVRLKHSLPQDVFILGYTGTMFYEDAVLMAATFNKIQAQKPNAKLLLIGYCNIAVEEMVKEKTAVLRTGPISFAELTDFVAACDVGWLPLADNAANRGRFPMKVNDFMAAGRPLIVSDVGDLGNFVEEHQLGWKAPANAAEMSRLVLEKCAEPNELNEAANQARHLAETKFAWPILTQILVDFYQSLDL